MRNKSVGVGVANTNSIAKDVIKSIMVMMMSEKRFSWKTEKLQHLDDEVLMVVDNENKEWKGHILNIVDLLNELSYENGQLKDENEQLIKEIKSKNKIIELYYGMVRLNE